MFDLYENIKKVARAHGYTPSGMCDAMGISKSTLSNLKNGRAETLSQATLHAIAAFLGENYDLVAHGKTGAPEGTFVPDPEVLALLEEMKDNSSVRVLLHAARDATPEQLRAVADMLESFKENR